MLGQSVRGTEFKSVPFHGGLIGKDSIFTRESGAFFWDFASIGFGDADLGWLSQRCRRFIC
jgi:hypothetical protein